MTLERDYLELPLPPSCSRESWWCSLRKGIKSMVSAQASPAPLSQVGWS